MENQRSIDMKSFFGFMVFMGILIEGFTILCKHHSHDIALRNSSDFMPFLVGFIPVILFAVIVWLVNRKAGNGNKMPIK